MKVPGTRLGVGIGGKNGRIGKAADFNSWSQWV